MRWPWKRFEAFFTAFSIRETVRRLDERRLAMVAGAWANSNMDDGKSTRQSFLRSVDESYERAVALLYDPEAEKIDKDDPFFAAMSVPEVPEGYESQNVQEVLLEVDVDQA